MERQKEQMKMTKAVAKVDAEMGWHWIHYLIIGIIRVDIIIRFRQLVIIIIS